MFYYIYVLNCREDKLYIGCTKDLRLRVKLHKGGKVKSTKERLPIELLYYEACRSRIKAYNREKYFKTGFGRKFLKNRT